MGWSGGREGVAAVRMVTQTADRTSPVRLELRAWTCLYRTWFVVSRVATHMPIALRWEMSVGDCAVYTLQDTGVCETREVARRRGLFVPLP